jgi:hypothetical protein
MVQDREDMEHHLGPMEEPMEEPMEVLLEDLEQLLCHWEHLLMDVS